jgi:PKD repeat protein
MSNYPTSIDNDQNLFTLHDSLRLTLSEDYLPGDTILYVEGDPDVYLRFPTIGYITLTEQCSDPEFRAISFSYSSKSVISDTLYSFGGIKLLSASDVEKPKKITHVTQNIMEYHHNSLKDAIISIEEFVGEKGTLDLVPYGETMEGRTNFLHKLVLQPKAWFSAVNAYGLIPLEVTFTNKCFKVGEGCPVDPVTYLWDFGDGDCSQISFTPVDCPSTIIVENVVPVDQINVKVLETEKGTITKTYSTPGKYDVTLTVTNKWGEDYLVIPGYVTARLPAPDEATISIIERSGQIAIPGDPNNGPPFTVFPKIRSSIDTFIDFEINNGQKPGTVTLQTPYGKSYAGEVLDSQGYAIDPIIDYSWQLSDDLAHGNAKISRASYSVGGLYDLILRVDTEFGAYRITTYEESMDIIENQNLWMWNFELDGVTAVPSEYGLISETFKTRPVWLTVDRNSDFLAQQNNSEQLIKEFNRNVFFSPRSTVSSGQQSNGLIYWSSGRNYIDSPSTEKINVMEYNGFTDTVSVPILNPTISRPWNWIGFNIFPMTYFILGNTVVSPAPFSSPTNQVKLSHNLSTLATNSTSSFSNTNYLNGADELMENVSIYNSLGQSEYGHFSVFRSTIKGSTGYISRNDGIGTFFRIKNFYKTEGVLNDPIQNIRKLPDILGTVKSEGQLVSLTSGIFFFNNSASISAYNDSSGVWETGSSGSTSAAFSSLQDNTVLGYSRTDNTLLAVSDGDRRAYLSFDYSSSAFIKFNEANLTFNSLISRPIGEQWIMHIY